jgi:hypothetical protein
LRPTKDHFEMLLQNFQERDSSSLSLLFLCVCETQALVTGQSLKKSQNEKKGGKTVVNQTQRRRTSQHKW